MNQDSKRRNFLRYFAGLAAIGAKPASARQTAPPSTSATSVPVLPAYARAQEHRSLKQSSYDRTGGNRDSWRIEPGKTFDVFDAQGPGVITHIWFTIAAQSGDHLKELVLRIYWDGNDRPSVEVPVGDFFGLNLGQYFIYQSAFLNCSSIKALNCYFAMPFQKRARATITNDGKLPVSAFYSNIDYKLVPSLPPDSAYFHAQYRQAAPTRAEKFASEKEELNINGEHNYVFLNAQGKGHLMGVTMGVVQNAEHWFGEGDEMIFIDDDKSPKITGTGTEDYFNGAWDFGGRDTAIPFAHLYNGAPFMALPERTGGRYCLYRWHADNPVTFEHSVKYTIEHGHADDRHDCYYSTAYWYQSEPYVDFPKFPEVSERIPAPVLTQS
jgi:hypothetical protein